MLIVDARLGKVVPLPCGPITLMTGPTVFSGNAPTITYPGGESVTIHAVRPKLLGLGADADLEVTYVDLDGRTMTSRRWMPLTVRFLHPKFPGRHVAFLPS